MSLMHAVTRRVPGAIEARTVSFVLSTSEEDRAGDTVDQTGWKVENYMRNPVVLWCHDQSEPPVGRCVSLGLQGGSLVGRVQFATAEQNPFADTIFKLVEGGFVNAGSVGFRPLRFEINEKGGLDYREQELLEFSIVGVPCNPQALASVKAAGLSLDETSRAFTAVERDERELREKLLAEARDKSARSIAAFKRAHSIRHKEIQLRQT